MSLREVEGPAGAPWERPMHGTLDRLVVESDAAGRQPARRPGAPAAVRLPPARAWSSTTRGRCPSVYVIQGYTGQLDMWFQRNAVRADDDRARRRAVRRRRLPGRDRRVRGRWTATAARSSSTPPPPGATRTTCATRSSPFVDARYPTLADRDHRGLAGKSSGGYGAMVVPMLRPDVFGALASHAGDALFEAGYLPEFPTFVRALRDHFEGSFDVFFERLADAGPLRLSSVPRRSSSTATPPPTRPTRRSPGKALLPSTSRPAGSSTTCGRSGWRRTRCGWRPPTRTRCARCAASTWTRARATSTSSTSARRRSPPSWTSSASTHTLELFDGAHGGLTLPLPGRDPRARHGAGLTERDHASTEGHGP